MIFPNVLVNASAQRWRRWWGMGMKLKVDKEPKTDAERNSKNRSQKETTTARVSDWGAEKGKLRYLSNSNEVRTLDRCPCKFIRLD